MYQNTKGLAYLIHECEIYLFLLALVFTIPCCAQRAEIWSKWKPGNVKMFFNITTIFVKSLQSFLCVSPVKKSFWDRWGLRNISLVTTQRFHLHGREITYLVLLLKLTYVDTRGLLCSMDIKYFNDNTPDKYHWYFKALSVPPTLLVELGRIVSTKFCLLKQIVCAN